MPLKYYFYTVSYMTTPMQNVTVNGVLVTNKDYFSLNFLLKVAFKDKPNTVVQFWTELSRDAILDYLGTHRLLSMENLISQQNEGTGLSCVLRLVSDEASVKPPTP